MRVSTLSIERSSNRLSHVSVQSPCGHLILKNTLFRESLTVRLDPIDCLDFPQTQGPTGPSGSGKSTLLSILRLLEEFTGGSYQFKASEVGKMSFGEKARIRNAEIGFIFQNFNLIGELSVRDNVALPLTFRSAFSSRERARRVSFALERVGMEAFVDKRPWELSGGQQQRVAVARAIAGSPAIRLADEPTGNLDTENGQTIMGLLASLNCEGNTVCLITHQSQ